MNKYVVQTVFSLPTRVEADSYRVEMNGALTFLSNDSSNPVASYAPLTWREVKKA